MVRTILSIGATTFLGTILIGSSGFAMTSKTCISYSGVCSMAIHFRTPVDEVQIEILNHARAGGCELTPGQTVKLTPTPPRDGGGIGDFDGMSEADSRWLILRLDPSTWTQKTFAGTLLISLRSDPYTYGSNSISCR